jgi:predicted AlkP superfamily pyrophosphatase or phosphodiesterase
MRRFLLILPLAACLFARQPLVVVSIDGLDNRYLTDADRLGLKIPNLRRLMHEGEVSRGIIGVVPTVTWPSHTTMLTGVDPVIHGILANQRPKSDGGEYYWSVSLLKVPTLLDAAHKAGLKAATVTWPVTVDAPVDWDLPEYFHKRSGGGMDLRSIESKAQPAGLVAEIAAAVPSFGQEFMDDRTRTLAVVYLLQNKHPDLLLVHLAELDSASHENGPFTREANSILEYSDELIGQIRAAVPPDGVLAVVSDHGFERVETVVNLKAAAAQLGAASVAATGALAIAHDAAAADALRKLKTDVRYGVGREIPAPELQRFPSAVVPPNAAAVFESAEGFLFSETGEILSKPGEAGNHGHWPMRYRAVYVMWGRGITHKDLPEFSMKEIAGRFARVIDVPFPPGR